MAMLESNKIKIFRLLIVVTFLGCSFLPRQNGTANLVRVQGHVIRPQELAVAKTVLIIPFSAGIHAEASAELDQSALIILRGISDGLKQSGRPYQILQEIDSFHKPDLTMMGHIEYLETRDSLNRYLGGRRKHFVEITGKVIDRDGNVVATFDHQLEKSYAEMNEMNFLLAAGQDVGKFLSQ